MWKACISMHPANFGNFGSNVAAINTLAPSSTGNQVAAAVGLRHRF